MPKIRYIRKHIFPLLSVLTIGFPFVGYKILGGVVICRLYDNVIGHVLAAAFIIWGLIDFVLNAVSFHALCCRGHDRYPVCLLSIAARRHPTLRKWEDAGEALDIMLSFCIVAWVVGSELFPFMDRAQVKLWNICTVVNVLGAGIARLGGVMTARRNDEEAISDSPVP